MESWFVMWGYFIAALFLYFIAALRASAGSSLNNWRFSRARPLDPWEKWGTTRSLAQLRTEENERYSFRWKSNELAKSATAQKQNRGLIHEALLKAKMAQINIYKRILIFKRIMQQTELFTLLFDFYTLSM